MTRKDNIQTLKSLFGSIQQLSLPDRIFHCVHVNKICHSPTIVACNIKLLISSYRYYVNNKDWILNWSLCCSHWYANECLCTEQIWWTKSIGESIQGKKILRRWACTQHWLWQRCCPVWAPVWSHQCMWRCTWPVGKTKERTNNRHQIRLGRVISGVGDCYQEPGTSWKILVLLLLLLLPNTLQTDVFPNQISTSLKTSPCW